jgi:hypothetical protein
MRVTIEDDPHDPADRFAPELEVEQLESIAGRNPRYRRSQPVIYSGKHLT